MTNNTYNTSLNTVQFVGSAYRIHWSHDGRPVSAQSYAMEHCIPSVASDSVGVEIFIMY